MEKLRQDIAPGSPVRGHLRPTELHGEPSAIEWGVNYYRKCIQSIFVFCYSLYLSSSVKWEWCKEQDAKGNIISGNRQLAEEKHLSIQMLELLCSTLILTHSPIFHYKSVFPPRLSFVTSQQNIHAWKGDWSVDFLLPGNCLWLGKRILLTVGSSWMQDILWETK